ncbi:MAG: helix-turn-helix domain-containing protein [Saccharolobus sp.]
MIKSYSITLSHDDWSFYTDRFKDEAHIRIISRTPSISSFTVNIIGVIYARDRQTFNEVSKVIRGYPKVLNFDIINLKAGKDYVIGTYSSIERLDGRIASLLFNRGIFNMKEEIRDGIEKWRVVSQPSSFKDILPSLKEMTNYLKVDEENYTIEELTPKEREMLNLALERGYFDEPRRVGLYQLSEHAGITKVAVMKTLRKALRKLVMKELSD